MAPFVRSSEPDEDLHRGPDASELSAMELEGQENQITSIAGVMVGPDCL